MEHTDAGANVVLADTRLPDQAGYHHGYAGDEGFTDRYTSESGSIVTQRIVVTDSDDLTEAPSPSGGQVVEFVHAVGHTADVDVAADAEAVSDVAADVADSGDADLDEDADSDVGADVGAGAEAGVDLEARAGGETKLTQLATVLDLGLADLFGEPMEWQERALCAQTDPEAFFPEKGGSTREAKRICSGCEVQVECLEYALANDERFGIWGGMSERERRKQRRRAV